MSIGKFQKDAVMQLEAGSDQPVYFPLLSWLDASSHPVAMRLKVR